MKTKNSKLQKTELSSLTSLIILIALVLILNAKVNASEKITRLNTETEAYAELLIAEHDAGMNIESWMLNENYFLSQCSSGNSLRSFTGIGNLDDRC
jgi:hypothetical protein